MTRVALTIAGSDPSGGAGIQADLKTFHQFGVYGEAVITLLTVQNTLRVERIETVSVDLVIAQLRAVIGDIPPHAAKTGALGAVGCVTALAQIAAEFRFPLVVDPVMISKHGASLLPRGAVAALTRELLPRATLVTPNLPEAEALTGETIDNLGTMKRAARAICDLGPRAALVKGGHASGDATDILYTDGEWYEFPAPRIDTIHTHGTGCTYSAAITAGLALGLALPVAILNAKNFIAAAIASNPGLGQGAGPVNHHAPVGEIR